MDTDFVSLVNYIRYCRDYAENPDGTFMDAPGLPEPNLPSVSAPQNSIVKVELASEPEEPETIHFSVNGFEFRVPSNVSSTFLARLLEVTKHEETDLSEEDDKEISAIEEYLLSAISIYAENKKATATRSEPK